MRIYGLRVRTRRIILALVPISPTYPGVYIEEIPSGVRTISGVATSITAFIGSAERGRDNFPEEINNLGEYERLFGALRAGDMMGYAVRDFYLNGGSKALIVRIHNGATRARIAVPSESGATPLNLEASSVGAWGNRLQVGVDYGRNGELAQSAGQFNLHVFEQRDGVDLAQETFVNLSVDPNSPRFVGRVLNQESILVRTESDANGDPVVPSVRPAPTTAPASPPSSPPSTILNRISAAANSGGDGQALTAAEYEGSESQQTGVFALEQADLFNLLCIPPPVRNGDTATSVYQKALQYCVRRRAMLSTACAASPSRPRRLGRAHPGRRRRHRADEWKYVPFAGWRCSSRRACSIAAPSGWCSSRTTSRSGRRSASTSARSCRTCSARARSRAQHAGRPTS